MDWQTTRAGVVKLARGPNGEAVALEHDANGRVIRRTVTRNGFRPQTWEFGWNAMDQLVEARCPDGRVWTYAYDPFGRRISKETHGIRHDFLWDGDVIARESVNGAAVDWFFEPRSFRPLARLEAGSLSYVVTDHLGTPKEVLSSGGSLLWSSDHDTWGSLRTIRAAFVSGDYWTEEVTETPAETASVLYCPIRSRGQWEDEETGLVQNRFRYYDPFCGQYVSADPIGLLGGERPYGYVTCPNQFYDVFGLACCCNPIRYAINDSLTPQSGGRQTGINRAWRQEQQLVELTGAGTYPWSPAQISELLSEGSVSGFTGHHINNVAQFPEWQGDPRNIAFLSTTPNGGDHLNSLQGHRGNYQNPTSGRLIDREATMEQYRRTGRC